MKIMQSHVQYMDGKKINYNYGEFMPDINYPNGDLEGYHDFYEIEWFLTGKGLHYINSIPFTVEDGYIFLVRPMDYHHYDLAHTHVKRWNIKFVEDVLTPDVRDLLACTRHPCSTVLAGKAYQQIGGEVAFLQSVLDEKNPDEVLAKNIVNRICIFLCQALSLFHTETVLPDVGHAVDDRLRRLLDYIGENCLHQITLEECARFMGLTECYFGNYFRKNTGLRFSEYLNRLRLHHSAELLLTTNLSVKEIAFHVGFHSSEYFSREFRKYYGKTPLTYRAEHK